MQEKKDAISPKSIKIRTVLLLVCLTNNKATPAKKQRRTVFEAQIPRLVIGQHLVDILLHHLTGII